LSFELWLGTVSMNKRCCLDCVAICKLKVFLIKLKKILKEAAFLIESHLSLTLNMLQKKLGFYVATISLALLALLGTQYYWINYSLDLRTEELDNEVERAVVEVRDKLEEQYYCFELFTTRVLDTKEDLWLITRKNGASQNGDSRAVASDTIRNFSIDWGGKMAEYPVHRLNYSSPINVRMQLSFDFYLDSLRPNLDSLSKTEEWVKKGYRNELIDLSTGTRIIDTTKLTQLLAERMAGSGIGTYYSAVTRSRGDSLVYATHAGWDEQMRATGFTVPLFTQKDAPDNYELTVFLPNKNGVLLGNLWGVIALSIGVLTGLILMLVFFAKTLLQQKRLAEMKTDFVNNMTHEFNTPVSNINLALDTIDRQGKLEGTPSMAHILSVIREENDRLKNNIEAVMRTSLMEREEIRFDKQKTDLHELVEKVCRPAELQLNGHGGSITRSLNAGNSTLLADPIHLTNALGNLLDNALKYSGNKPLLEISTCNVNGELCLSVKDQGMGISKEALTRIFEKFYRVPTGNVHNIQGFGIGLAYVKYVVEAHRGRIEVESRPNEGSVFKLFLPIETA